MTDMQVSKRQPPTRMMTPGAVKVPPHSVEAEQSVLGGVMLESRAWDQIVDKLREELEDLIQRKVAPIKVIEIKNPDLNAQLVAEAVAEQLKKRASFRRVLKMRMESTMQAGAKGIKFCISGRLGGAEIARQEKAGTGSVPLTTLQANIDYGYAIALLFGAVGWCFIDSSKSAVDENGRNQEKS